MTSYFIKVSFTVMIYLQSFHSTASNHCHTYLGLDEKIAQTLQPKEDSTDFLVDHKSVDLVSTAVIQENNYVKISWETGMEMNNSLFTIERSTDVQNWEKIIELDGAGISSQNQSYSTIDKTPNNGISYYRIKSTDFDGNYEYSRVVAIDVVLNSVQVQIFPQPAEDFVTLLVSGLEDENLELTILSLDGLMVKETVKGFSDNRFNVSDLNAGIYFIHIKNTDQSEVYRMIKK